MKKLTVEKAQELLEFLTEKAKDGNITLAQENYLQALELALPVLEAKRDAEMFGSGFVACFTGGEVRKGDPDKVRISFTDSGLGYDLPVVNSPAIPDGWIKCSDRLPGSDGNYWGWWNESQRQGPVWFTKGKYHAAFQSYEITHWMPLPAAPKPEAL